MIKTPVSVKNKRRIALGFTLLALLMAGLTFRVGWIQIVQADELTQMARDQQTRDTPIEARRGDIYDRNGKELATSVTCYSLWVWPAKLAESADESKIDEYAAQISEITGVKQETVKQRLTREQSLVRVAKELEKEQADALREMGVSALSLSEDTKRYYPSGNFASQLLGSVTDDNTGRTGIELEYDQYLSGVAGRWVKNTDVAGNQLVDGSEEYHEAQDGLNVVLTIDETIQYYAEKALEKGMKESKAEKIMCLIMDPKTGEILASAVTPGFDPNDPSKPDDKEEAKNFAKLNEEDQLSYLFKMWRNPIVSDTYEPGSTFKLITSSSAIEEEAITLTDTFKCSGSINVAGSILHCWSNRSHGVQTIKQAVGNSCNPVLAQVAAKLGKTAFYKYIDLYGLRSRTGVDYPGETTSITYDLDSVGPVELATMGYGQSISITPIQLLTAVCSIGNDGVLMKPRYVKALTDSTGKVVKEFEPTEVRRVISKETAAEMKDIMEYVVAEGGGGGAKIAGYRVGGKTGTANKVENGKYGKNYYSSFIGMAPINDPQIAILVVVDSPKGSYYGSLVACPIAKSILTDALRYMNVEPQYTEEEKAAMESNYTTVPNVTGYEYSEAAGIIAGKQLSCKNASGAGEDYIVAAQYPAAGTKVKLDSEVYVYRQ